MIEHYTLRTIPTKEYLEKKGNFPLLEEARFQPSHNFFTRVCNWTLDPTPSCCMLRSLSIPGTLNLLFLRSVVFRIGTSCRLFDIITIKVVLTRQHSMSRTPVWLPSARAFSIVPTIYIVWRAFSGFLTGSTREGLTGFGPRVSIPLGSHSRNKTI
jgi:hypothetical protein